MGVIGENEYLHRSSCVRARYARASMNIFKVEHQLSLVLFCKGNGSLTPSVQREGEIQDRYFDADKGHDQYSNQDTYVLVAIQMIN